MSIIKCLKYILITSVFNCLGPKEWTSWFQTFSDICRESCTRKEQFARLCLQNGRVVSQYLCPGRSFFMTKFINCTGDLCGKFINSVHIYLGARCSSVVRAFTNGTMGHRIDHSWWTHWAISHSSQCPTTGVLKAVVCVILSVG